MRTPSPPSPSPRSPSRPLGRLSRRLGIASLALVFASIGLVAAPSANALVSFHAASATASGEPLSALFPGSLVTIDITIRNDGDPIYGILAAVYGYDRNIVSFVSGTASASLFSTVCLPAAGCFGGLLNEVTVDLVEEDGRVVFARGLTGAPVTNTGEMDIGIDGFAGGPQARVTFQIVRPGTTGLFIGTDLSFGGGVVGPGGTVDGTNNTLVNVTFLPEPNTSLLLGLGLALLSGSRSARAGTMAGTRA